MTFDLLLEVTDWEYPNHTYLHRGKDGKIYGYIKSGTTDMEMFKKPMMFYKSKRKFKKLETIVI
jgi:hypothetical protein